jgi:hypothetical protein
MMCLLCRAEFPVRGKSRFGTDDGLSPLAPPDDKLIAQRTGETLDENVVANFSHGLYDPSEYVKLRGFASNS